MNTRNWIFIKGSRQSRSDEEREDMEEELIDRFGDIRRKKFGTLLEVAALKAQST